jgi:hypothetical protein
MSRTPALIVCFIGMFVAGCAVTTSELLVNPGLSNGPSRGEDVGIIRYLAQGSSADIQQRQQDANFKMSNTCQGKYRVLSTRVNNQLDVNGVGRFRANATSNDYIYIRFVCTGPK